MQFATIIYLVSGNIFANGVTNDQILCHRTVPKDLALELET